MLSEIGVLLGVLSKGSVEIGRESTLESNLSLGSTLESTPISESTSDSERSWEHFWRFPCFGLSNTQESSLLKIRQTLKTSSWEVSFGKEMSAEDSLR